MFSIARSSLFRAIAGLSLMAAAGALLGIGVAPRPAAADWVRNDQWQVRSLDARDAWKLATGEGVIVAVIDSGVDATHPDLVGQVLPGADFVDGTTDGRTDFVGHGTTIAGLIAARGDDNSGVVGLAPRAKILPVRVLDKDNKYSDPAVVANGIRWAVDHQASIINLSLGGQLRSDVLADALEYAASHDVVVVACTGNVESGETSRDVWYPAREPGVVAVAGLSGTGALGDTAAPAPSTAESGGAGGSSSNTDPLWSDSLTGPQTVLTAPAVNLLGARPGGYWHVQGTSFAAPLVAATAALIRSRYPGMSAANVVNRLISTARDLGPTGRDDRYGYGEVNPVAALRSEAATVSANPLTGAPDLFAPGLRAAPGAGTPTPAAQQSAAGEPSASVEQGILVAGDDPAPDAGGAIGMSATKAAKQEQMDASFAVGGIVTALLFLAGVVLFWRRRTE